MRIGLCILLTLLLPSCSSTSPDRQSLSAPAGDQTFGSGPRLNYLVLGDSTAVGEGGTYDAGIAVETARHLADDHQVRMRNLAVSGAKATDVLHEQLPRIGEFKPDVVLLDVGANDAIRLTTGRALRRDLRAIIRSLVERNCDVKIVVTGSPDMSTPPRIPALLRPVAGWRSRKLNDVFRAVVSESDLTFAPIAAETGPLFERDPSLFSADDFHPNDRGYRTWIDVIKPALDRALATQPGHCERPSEEAQPPSAHRSVSSRA